MRIAVADTRTVDPSVLMKFSRELTMRKKMKFISYSFYTTLRDVIPGLVSKLKENWITYQMTSENKYFFQIYF